MRRFGFTNLGRVVTRDAEFHGVELKKGEMVMVSTTMSGVDESAWPNAMEVDFERKNARANNAFGKGIHNCAGQRLARNELRVLLAEILPALPNLRLQAGADVRVLPGAIMSLRSLPVEWDVQ